MTRRKKILIGIAGVLAIALVVVGIIFARKLGQHPAEAPSPTPTPAPKARGLGNDRFGPHARAQATENVDIGVKTVNITETANPSAAPKALAMTAAPYASPKPSATPRPAATPITLATPPSFAPLAPAPAPQGREAVIVYSVGQTGKRQIYLRSLERDRNEQLVTSVYDDYGVSMSSSNQKVAFYSNEEGTSDATRPRSKLKVVDLATGKVATIAGNLPGVWPVAWSPDGSQLAIPTANSIFIANVKTGRALQVPTGKNPGGIIWSPNNLTFYFQAEVTPDNTDLYQAEAITAGARPVVTGPTSERYPSVSTDGTKITFLRDQAGKGAAVVVRGITGGEEHTYAQSQPADSYLWNLDFSTLLVEQRTSQGKLIVIKNDSVKPLGDLTNPIMVGWDRDYGHAFVLADDDQGKSLFSVDVNTGQAEKIKAGVADAAAIPSR